MPPEECFGGRVVSSYALWMIRVANAPCSWGVLDFQPLRPPPFPQVLDEINLTGYAGTELGDWGFMPADPVQLAPRSQERDLRLVAAFVLLLSQVFISMRRGSTSPSAPRGFSPMRPGPRR